MQQLTVQVAYELAQLKAKDFDKFDIELVSDTFIKNEQQEHSWIDFDKQLDKIKQYVITYNNNQYQMTIQVKGRTFFEQNKNYEDYFYIDFEVLELGKMVQVEKTNINKIGHDKSFFINRFIKLIGVTKEQVIDRCIHDRYDIASQIDLSDRQGWHEDSTKSMIYLISSLKTVDTWHCYVGLTIQDDLTSRVMSHKYHFSQDNKYLTGDLLFIEKAIYTNILLVDTKDEEELIHFETLLINYCAYKFGKKICINSRQVGKTKKSQREQIIKELVWIIVHDDIDFSFNTSHMRKYLGIHADSFYKTMHSNVELINELSYEHKGMKALLNLIVNTTDITVQEISDNMPHIDKEVTVYVKSNNREELRERAKARVEANKPKLTEEEKAELDRTMGMKIDSIWDNQMLIDY